MDVRSGESPPTSGRSSAPAKQPTYDKPITYERIERGLQQAINAQMRLTNQFASTGDILAEADIAFRRAYAQARVRFRHDIAGGKVTEGMIADDAALSTESEYKDLQRAKSQHEAVKQALYSTRDRMDALRSLMASHRIATGDTH